MPFKAEDFKDDKAFQDYIKQTVEAATTPLNNTNSGLLKDLKKLKEAAKKFDGVDLDALKAASAELEELKKAKNDKETDAEKALREMRERTEKTEKHFTDKIQLLENANNALIVDQQLRTLLIAANVKSELIDTAVTLLKVTTTVDTSTGTPVAHLDDLPLSEGVQKWIKSDVGKNFVAAAKNRGGGAGGGGGSDDTDVDDTAPTKEELGKYGKYFDKESGEFNRTQQAKIRVSNTALYSKLLKHYANKK